MTHSSVEPMAKSSRIRDFDKATEKKSRRFKKQNVDNGKRSFSVDDAEQAARNDKK